MSNPDQTLPEGLERRRDPLGLLEATDDATMDEVRAEIMSNDQYRATYARIGKAIQAYERHVHAFSAEGLTPRNAKRSAAKRMGLTLKQVNTMIDNYNEIRQLLGIGGAD